MVKCKYCKYSELVMRSDVDPQQLFGCKVKHPGKYVYVDKDETCKYAEPIPSYKNRTKHNKYFISTTI